ncbi:MAG TPA: glycosyltransferase family 2 protein [Candidatus Binatia bacterium]|nr:glycosyltransferase family 2 protein [Candidatus Binatia bacterium]
MKLVIQIPCYNEAETLPATLRDLPNSVPGIDSIEVLVIDDGSDDGTAAVARANGVKHVVRAPDNQGLARAFAAGLDYALKIGADIIVNTDGDNQYRGGCIAKLVAPILHHEAEVVVGNRNPARLGHFSFIKRRLQALGSSIVRGLSGTNIPDVTSGFRAFSREAALRMNVVSEFTYTLETVIQAGIKQLAVTHVDIDVNPVTRPSRLFPNIRSYLVRSAVTIVRIYALYNPLRVFVLIGGALLLGGLGIGIRFTVYYFLDGGAGHIQSLILAAVMLITGFQAILFGIIADLVGSNRRMIEDALLRIRRVELRERD